MTSKARMLWAFALSSIAVFMTALDNLVVTTALPVIKQELGGGIQHTYAWNSKADVGTVHAQSAWLPVTRTLGLRPWFGGRVMVSGAGKAFDDKGELVDERAREQLASFRKGFAAFVTDCHRQRGRAS